MATISSLLKSAASAQKKAIAFQDQIEAYNWNSSAQTYDDFTNYSKYLTQRATQTTDPSEQLSYQTTIRAAQRSYTSNEIQRATQDVMEGRGDTGSKMNVVRNLFDQAIANGDSNLAQNLFSTWQTLSVQQQNEQAAAVKSYQAAGEKAFSDLKTSLTKGVDDVTLPNGHTVTPLAELGRIFQQTGDTVGVMKSAQETLQALADVNIDAYKNATTQDQADKLEEQFGPGLADLYDNLKIKVGGENLTAQDVTNAIANDQMNNPTYGLKSVHNESTGQTDYQLTKNNVDNINYVRQIDAQGNETYVPAQIRTDKSSLFFGTSDQGRSLNTLITNNGEVIGGNTAKSGQPQQGQINAGQGTSGRDSSQSIKNRLLNLGIQASGDGTTIKIKLPGENIERTATIQPDGSIRFFADNGQIAEIGLVDRNLGTDAQPKEFKAGDIRLVSPEEVSDFGSNSAFGGQLSAQSAQGTRYVNDIIGKIQPKGISLNGPINTANDFSGFGTSVTSNLLQSATYTQKQIQLQQQEAQMIQAQQQALQSSAMPNLNQVPIQQLTSQGLLKKQLQVAPPAPTPRVVVAAPAPTPKVTVGAPLPTPRITSVSVAPAQPRVVVR